MQYFYRKVHHWLILLVLIASFSFSGCLAQIDKRQYAGLQVTTNDLPATLYLDGEYLSDTPVKRNDLKPGTYTLKIQPEDPTYVPYEVPIQLRKGLLTAVTWLPGTRPELGGGVIYELEKLPNRTQTELIVTSIPDGAIVKVDGGDLEFAPIIKSELLPGKHDISVTLPSYVEQNHTLNLVAGHRLSVLVKLAKTPESLGLTIPTPSADAMLTATASGQAATGSGALAAASSQSGPTPIRSAQPTAGNLSNLGNNSQQVLILPTNFFQDGTEVVRVRSASTSASAEVGFATVGERYPYLNEENAAWIKIDLNGKAGWINKTYAELQ